MREVPVGELFIVVGVATIISVIALAIIDSIIFNCERFWRNRRGY